MKEHEFDNLSEHDFAMLNDQQLESASGGMTNSFLFSQIRKHPSRALCVEGSCP